MTLWFPVADITPTPMKIEGRVPRGGADGPVRLMLVDDDAVVREMLAEELEGVGGSVIALEDGLGVLRRLDTDVPVDVLVSDLSMPGMNGVASIREAQKRRPDLPAILLTGFASPVVEFAISAEVQGRVILMRQPVEGQTLAERIAVLLEGQQPMARN